MHLLNPPDFLLEPINMEHDIFTLTVEDLNEYAQNYEADHLKPGDVV